MREARFKRIDRLKKSRLVACLRFSAKARVCEPTPVRATEFRASVAQLRRGAFTFLLENSESRSWQKRG